jgi:transposase
MGKYSEVYVAFDTAKLKHAVAIAEGGRQGEIRFVGEIPNQPAAIERLIKKLAGGSEIRFHLAAGFNTVFGSR